MFRRDVQKEQGISLPKDAFELSDYVSDQDDHRSISGYVFILNGEAVVWSSKKQPVIFLLATKIEFISIVYCAYQAVWMRIVLES